VDVVVADEVGEAGILAAQPPASGGQGRGRRRAEGERGTEQARAAQEPAAGHALRIEGGVGDGRIGPGGQLLLGHDGSRGFCEVSGS
jgi:hypothetical protein